MEGDWLVALRQDSGRGRHGRRWEAIEGNFFGSTLVRIRSGDPPAPALAMVAGLALIEAVATEAPAAPLSLKWPNDLMLGDGKLAGILLERSGDRVVAGFGVNLAGAPSIAGRKTAALSTYRNMSPEGFAPIIAGSFAQLLAAWRRSEPASLAEAWMAKAHPVGTALEVHGGHGELTRGRFAGIEPDGAMRLVHDDGTTSLVRAGDVQLG